MKWMHDKEIEKTNKVHFPVYISTWRREDHNSVPNYFLEKYLLKKFKAVANTLTNNQFRNGICATGKQSKEHTHLKEEILT